jgi:2-hydroxychromene-2-carboxylate isomerase
MKTPLQFYFDFSSPYGYFAAVRIDELAAEFGRLVDWHPVLLGVIFKTTETRPLLQLPLKGPYSRHDLTRTARHHQIAFKLPTIFPIASHQTARAMLLIQNKHGKDIAKQFAKKCYHSYFVDDINIIEVEAILKIAEDCGVNREEVANGIQLPEIKDQL